MTPRFTNLIREIVKEYDRTLYKSVNFTETYSIEYLEKLATVFRDWLMTGHRVQPEEPDTMILERPMTEDEFNDFIDKLAEEDEDYRLHQQNQRKHRLN